MKLRPNESDLKVHLFIWQTHQSSNDNTNIEISPACTFFFGDYNPEKDAWVIYYD